MDYGLWRKHWKHRRCEYIARPNPVINTVLAVGSILGTKAVAVVGGGTNVGKYSYSQPSQQVNKMGVPGVERAELALACGSGYSCMRCIGPTITYLPRSQYSCSTSSTSHDYSLCPEYRSDRNHGINHGIRSDTPSCAANRQPHSQRSAVSQYSDGHRRRCHRWPSEHHHQERVVRVP